MCRMLGLGLLLHIQLLTKPFLVSLSVPGLFRGISLGLLLDVPLIEPLDYQAAM